MSGVVKAKLQALGSSNSNALKGKTSWILGENDKTTFFLGRHKDADCLVADPCVSRRHATFQFSHESAPMWKVVDHKSMHGISINAERISPEEPKVLKNGDVVSIDAAYSWSFEFPVKDAASNKFITTIDAKLKEALSRLSRDKVDLDQKVRDGEVKQLELTHEKEALAKKLEEERLAFAKKQEEERSQFEAKLEASNEQRQEFQRKLAQDLKVMEEKQREASVQLEDQIKASERKMKEVIKEREDMVKVTEMEKVKLESQMVEMRQRFQEQVDKLESNFRDEKATSEEYKSAMDKLETEFQDKFKREHAEFEKKMAEAKAAEKAEKDKLAQELETKNDQIAKLAKELDDQKRKREEEAVTSRKKLKADFAAQCNSELKCSVCDELFIEPMSLNCGHVYCQFCLDQWKKTCATGKSPFTCPNCREVITNTAKSIHLQNLIDSLYTDSANQELKTERQQVIAERKGVKLGKSNKNGT